MIADPEESLMALEDRMAGETKTENYGNFKRNQWVA